MPVRTPHRIRTTRRVSLAPGSLVSVVEEVEEWFSGEIIPPDESTAALEAGSPRDRTPYLLRWPGGTIGAGTRAPARPSERVESGSRAYELLGFPRQMRQGRRDVGVEASVMPIDLLYPYLVSLQEMGGEPVIAGGNGAGGSEVEIPVPEYSFHGPYGSPPNQEWGFTVFYTFPLPSSGEFETWTFIGPGWEPLMPPHITTDPFGLPYIESEVRGTNEGEMTWYARPYLTDEPSSTDGSIVRTWPDGDMVLAITMPEVPTDWGTPIEAPWEMAVTVDFRSTEENFDPTTLPLPTFTTGGVGEGTPVVIPMAIWDPDTAREDRGQYTTFLAEAPIDFADEFLVKNRQVSINGTPHRIFDCYIDYQVPRVRMTLRGAK